MPLTVIDPDRHKDSSLIDPASPRARARRSSSLRATNALLEPTEARPPTLTRRRTSRLGQRAEMSCREGDAVAAAAVGGLSGTKVLSAFPGTRPGTRGVVSMMPDSARVRRIGDSSVRMSVPWSEHWFRMRCLSFV